MLTAAALVLLLLVFAVNWRYFRDWVTLILFSTTLNLILGSMVVEKGLLSYPVKIFQPLFDTSLLFELWVFHVLCLLYNQVTPDRGIWPAVCCAALFGAGITAIKHPLEPLYRLD